MLQIYLEKSKYMFWLKVIIYYMCENTLTLG